MSEPILKNTLFSIQDALNLILRLLRGEDSNQNPGTYFPVTAQITGIVNVVGNVDVDNFPSLQGVSGTVSVNNFPPVQPVNDNGGSLTIDGTVSVSNLSTDTNVTGTIWVNNVNQGIFGENITADIFPQASWRFDYGINTKLINTTLTSSGTITTDQSRAKLSSGLSSTGAARITTINRLRYLPGFGGLVRLTVVFNTGVSSSQQIIGLGDTGDGFFFGYDGINFGVMRRRDGSDNWIYENSWNGSPLSETLNKQVGNIYQIEFQWLGYGIIKFSVYDKNVRNYVNVHTILYPNTSALTHIINPTLPLFAEIKNSGNNTNISMYTPSALAATEGVAEQPHHPLSIFNSFDNSATFANSNNNHLVTIRNKSTFSGVVNRLPIQIRSIDISRTTSGAPTSTIRLYKNATTSGDLTYSDIDTNNSPIEVSTTTTTITSTNSERTYTVTANVALRTLTFLPGELIVQPGDSLSIGVTNSSLQSTDLIATINWEELF